MHKSHSRSEAGARAIAKSTTFPKKARIRKGHDPWMPRWDYLPSGELRLHLSEPGYSYTHKSWNDTQTRPLETQIKKIVHRRVHLR